MILIVSYLKLAGTTQLKLYLSTCGYRTQHIPHSERLDQDLFGLQAESCFPSPRIK